MKFIKSTLFLVTNLIFLDLIVAQPNLIPNGGFENYDPIINVTNPTPSAYYPNANGGNTYVDYWHVNCDAPYIQIPPNYSSCGSYQTPDVYIRNGYGQIPGRHFLSLTKNPNTWNYPTPGNDAMAGGSFLESLETEFTSLVDPGDYLLKFYAFNSAFQYISSPNYPVTIYIDFYLKNTNTNQYILLEKAPIPYFLNAPTVPGVVAGWVPYTAIVNIPDIPANYGFDRLAFAISETDLSGNQYFHYLNKYYFIDDISLSSVHSISAKMLDCAPGSINITVTGNSAPYTYTWTGPNSFSSTAEDVSGLDPGIYNVDVTDVYGRTVSATYTIKSPILYVDLNATTGANNGQNWTDAFTDLQSALTEARNDVSGCIQQIWVSEGTYLPDNSDPFVSFNLVDGIRMYGGFSTDPAKNHTTMALRDWVNNKTFLSGDLDQSGGTNTNDSKCIVKSHGMTYSIFDGFIVKGAFDSDIPTYTAAMENYESIITVNNCRFEFNTGGKAAMWNKYCAAKITNCFFNNNETEMAVHFFFRHANLTRHNIVLNSDFDSNIMGLYSSNSELEIGNCRFTNNQNRGLTFINVNTANEFQLYDCLFQNNTSWNRGGAIKCESHGAEVLISRCKFIENSTTVPMFNSWGTQSVNGGGAMYINPYQTLSTTVESCEFLNNSALNSKGGAIYSNGVGPILFNNCLFDGNMAEYQGGAIMMEIHGNPFIMNCTFTNNSVSPCQYPLSCHPDASDNATIFFGSGGNRTVITSNIIWGNNAQYAIGHQRQFPGSPPVGGAFTSSSDVSYNIVEGSANGWPVHYSNDLGGNIDSDPLFVGLSDYRLRSTLPSPYSPAINSGNPTLVIPGVDINGAPRVQGGNVDMGAFESDPTIQLRKKTPEMEKDSTVIDLSKIIVFPNPSKGMFIFKNITDGQNKITVLDGKGREIKFHVNQIGQSIKLDISNHPDGIYIVCIQHGEYIHTSKVIKATN